MMLNARFIPDPERTMIVRTYGNGYYVAEDYHTRVVVQEWKESPARGWPILGLVAIYLLAGATMWLGGFYIGRAYECERLEARK